MGIEVVEVAVDGLARREQRTSYDTGCHKGAIRQ